MPIPILLWGAGAAAGAYLAWRNRDVLMDVAGKAAEGIAEANRKIHEMRTEDAYAELENLRSMSPNEAREHVSRKATTGDLNIARYPDKYLVMAIADAAQEDNSLASLSEYISDIDRKVSRAEDMEIEWASLGEEAREKWARSAISGMDRAKVEWLIEQTRDGTGDLAIPFLRWTIKKNEERASYLERALEGLD